MSSGLGLRQGGLLRRHVGAGRLSHLLLPAQNVERLALYPDDLVAIVLPASTDPLQLVQADRFLEKRKADPKLPVDENWDDAVKSLLNYPDIVKMMSNDLDWTSALGEAVVDDQGAVLDAIQAFRRKTQSAGNLKTDSKQVVEVCGLLGIAVHDHVTIARNGHSSLRGLGLL